MVDISLVPRPKEEEEEEKGPGFSRSRMRLIISELPSADQWEGANDTFKVTRLIAWRRYSPYQTSVGFS